MQEFDKISRQAPTPNPLPLNEGGGFNPANWRLISLSLFMGMLAIVMSRIEPGAGNLRRA